MIANEYGLIDRADAVVRTFGGSGLGLGQFDGVKAVAACSVPKFGGLVGGAKARIQLIAVSEANNCRVQIFRAVDGAPVRDLSAAGHTEDSELELDNPGQVDFGGSEFEEDPSLLVADRSHHRIHVWRGAGEQFVATYGVDSDLGSKKGGTKVQGRPPMRADYNGALACDLEDLKMSSPGGACWCEMDEGCNMIVVADSGNHRLQLLDLDSGTVRVLAGRDKVTAPSMVCYHNGWRWCSGPQSKQPPSPSTWPLPLWYLTSASSAGSSNSSSTGAAAADGGDEDNDSDDAIAEAAALVLWENYEKERETVEEEFEEQQRLAGGRLGEEDLEEAFEKLYGSFRVWPVKNGKVTNALKRVELCLGVLTKEAVSNCEACLVTKQPLRLTEFPITVTRIPKTHLVDRFWLRGRPYADLYALLAASKDVSRSHWSLPPHRRFLAVCEPLMGKVSVHAFWPSQHGVEYFVPMVRTLGDVGGRELPGKPGLQLDNPTAISMSPFGDLAIGDCRSGGPALNADTADDFVPHQRLLLYNVVTGVVAAVLTEPFKPVDPPGGGKSVNSIRSGDSLPPSIASGKSPVGSGGGGGSLNDGKEDGEEGEGGEEEWFATAPALIPCMCPDGSLLAIHAENSQGWQLDAPKDASKGRGGPFLGRLPPPIVNDIILAHLTYRNAEQARACCRWLHDWTKARRDTWQLWPLRPEGLCRLHKSFLDWARLGDGRRFASQHPPLQDPVTQKPLCGRYLRGRCGAGDLCSHSHAPPSIRLDVVHRRYEEKVFRADARHPLGLKVKESGPLEIATVERTGQADSGGCSSVSGWRVLAVGNIEVNSLREYHNALRNCSDHPDACQWEPGKESESTWSSRRPIEVVCQDFKPLRPYFTVIEWSGLGGFSCAAAEYFGLPWWWAHELQVRELFLAKAGLYLLDERRDDTSRGLNTNAMRTERPKPYPTPCLGFDAFVELMTVLTEVRFELTTFRVVFRSVFPPLPTHRTAFNPGAPPPALSASSPAKRGATFAVGRSMPGADGAGVGDLNGRSLSPLPQRSGNNSSNSSSSSGSGSTSSSSWSSWSSSSSSSSSSSRIGSNDSNTLVTITEDGNSSGNGNRNHSSSELERNPVVVSEGEAVSVPLSWRDGTPVAHNLQQRRLGSNTRAPVTLAVAHPGTPFDASTSSAPSSKSRGHLILPPAAIPPEPRGLGLNPLERHLQTFDYQARRLDAAMSALF